MCAKPYGLHAQSLTNPTDGFQTSIKQDGTGAVTEFSTNLPGNVAIKQSKLLERNISITR